MESSPLSPIPLEVRELIYQAYFNLNQLCFQRAKHETRIRVRPCRLSNSSQLFSKYTWIASDTQCFSCRSMGSALQRTCKQIFDEATRVFWRCRTLRFVIDHPQCVLRDKYRLADRIAAICCVRDYILSMTANRARAIDYLGKIDIVAHGLAMADLPETIDILQEVKVLLINWRTPAIAPLQIHLHLREHCRDQWKNTIRDFSASTTATMLQGLIDAHFPLPANRTVATMQDIMAQLCVSAKWIRFRQTTGQISSVWNAEILEGTLMIPTTTVENDDCALQRGCQCERHKGRTLLARDASVVLSCPTRKSYRRRLIAKLHSIQSKLR